MDTISLSKKIITATKLLEDFAGTTAALAPYPVLPVDTITLNKKKSKEEKHEEK